MLMFKKWIDLSTDTCTSNPLSLLNDTQSNLYFGYRIEDLITPHYWSWSVLYILTNQIMTISAVLTFRSEYTTCLRWHENVTTKQLSSSSKYCISFETCIWLVEIMTHYANTKFIWTQTVMGGYQILYAIA